jgi:hypothetical protein
MISPAPTVALDSATLPQIVRDIVFDTPVFDIHTHLYPASFRELSLWGIDELVNYHYLIAETFRSSSVKPAQFWQMTKQEQADLIWETLFVKNTPVSEACRGPCHERFRPRSKRKNAGRSTRFFLISYGGRSY